MPQVLVVDDDLGIRETLPVVLRAHGYVVVTADCGHRALYLSESSPPDAMLLDLQLPDIVGLDVIRSVRAKGNAFPIIVITGFGTIASAVAAMKLGAANYLEKPLDGEDLVESLHQALKAFSGPVRPAFQADGLTCWATAVTGVLGSRRDPRTLEEWAAIQRVAPATLRGWCRTVQLSPKRSLDLARILRATFLGRTHQVPADRLLRVADHRTLDRLLDGAGLVRRGLPPELEVVLERQKYVADRAALQELRRLLSEFAVRSDTPPG